MNKLKFIRIMLYLGLGILLDKMGFGLLTFQYWIITFGLVINNVLLLVEIEE